jgi:O-antigen ligase
VTAIQHAGSVLAALGVLALLWPLPGIDPTARRLSGLAAVVAGWLLLAVTLLPDSATDRLGTPAGGGAAVVGLAVAIAAGLGLALLVARWPTAWFVALALALPIRLPVSLGDEQARLLVPLYAVIAVGVLGWLVVRVRGRAAAAEDPATPLDPVVGAFAGYVLLSSLWSVNPEEAAIRAVFFYVPFVLLYLAAVAWWPRARALAALAMTTIGLAVPIAALALVQFATRDILWNSTLQQANVYSAFFRVNAIFYDPNILGRYLVLAILAAVAIAWRARDPRLLAGLWLVTAFLAAGLVPTFSRSSALMLLVGLALLSWRGLGGRRTLVAGAGVLVVIGALAFATSQSVRDATTSADRLEEVSEGRFGLVRGGLEIWRDDPVVGVGLGGFEDRFSETLTPAEQRRVRVVVSHNTPITVLSEEGVVGFALFLVLIAWTALVLTRASGRAGEEDGWAIWTMQAMLAGIVVHSLLYAALFEDPFTWVLAAGAAALAAAAPAAARNPAPAGEPAPAGG